MPSTENATLQRIQREISDVLEREKELRSTYVHQNGSVNNGHNHDEDEGNISNNNNSEHETNNNVTIPREKSPVRPVRPVLQQSKSMGALNGITSNGTRNGLRLFTPNPATRGVMHKFIKNRGKLSTVAAFQPTPTQIQQLQRHQQQTWRIPDVIDPPKVTEPGQCIRKGFVPVHVKMQKELEDLHLREMELRHERRKSHHELSEDDQVDGRETPQLETTLKPARSMAQLYDEERQEFNVTPTRLKPARSLADLCDASGDELDTPGSHSLIMKWEEMIQKNQQERL
ncbi:A-kinase anchor protein 2 C-terminus [Popillia japonica]|uniref:A-kinase anchor protein 2 C-terminus n=1 Tax=Popillia japonica TaxID=7064 RepID=A0AAW1LB55_POPJA